MRYSKEHLGEVRSRLLREGGRHVKERGMHGAGVDGIAKRVGLSGAALYTHFDSKQEFLGAVLLEELVATAERFLGAQGTIEEALAQYMSLSHARKAATGCPLPSLAADVARSGKVVRRSFEKGLTQIAESLAQKLKDPSQAMAVLAAAVGGVALARALPDDEQAEAVLSSTRELIARGLKNKRAKGAPARG
jgi:TetR/AcrR family transcriptional repressor of nem operon